MSEAESAPDRQPAVQVREVSKSFAARRPRAGGSGRAVPAVDGISFTVARGEIFGILGPNGSGKSTLIRLLSTLLLPDRGEVRIFGLDAVRERHRVRRLINRVSVEASFFKKLSAQENLAYSSGLYGVPRVRARAEMARLLGLLGLPRRKLDAPLEELSRGQQQKVAIVRALLTSPTLMLLDEPTTGLDPRSRREVQDLIALVRREHDATVLLCTHDLPEAERLCERVAVMAGGRFLALDTPAALAGDQGLEAAFFRLVGSALEANADPEDDEAGPGA
jgi:ABC-2 type transport system ATP-binding protein